MMNDPKDAYSGYDQLFYSRDMQSEVSDHLNTVDVSQEEIDELIKQQIIKRFPRSAEKLEGTYQRSLRLKSYVQSIIDGLSDENKHKKILIISHSVFFKIYTGTWVDLQRPVDALPDDFIYLRNCELYPENKHFP